jgi:hypothetical protein
MVNLEESFDTYIKSVGLKKKELSKVQLVETRRAFFGGLQTCFNMLAFDTAGMTQDQANEFFKGVKDGVNDFWVKENEKAGKKNIEKKAKLN